MEDNHQELHSQKEKNKSKMSVNFIKIILQIRYN